MSYYLVSARPKASRLRALRGKLRQHAFEELFPFGETLTRSLENARLREDGFATWEEADHGDPPLVLERGAALDEFFEELSMIPVQEGSGWERIARLPWLFPEFTTVAVQSPYALGFTTLEAEVHVTDLTIRGRIPSWLSGSLVRTGPARFEAGNQRMRHWFDGLAMLHRFTLEDGRAGYANRYLRSHAYELAMDPVARPATRAFATTLRPSLSQRIAGWFSPWGTDNGIVNIASWAGGALALTESRFGVRFDPETLTAFGGFAYDGGAPEGLATAFPLFDAERRAHYNCMLDAGSRTVYRFFRMDEATASQTVVAAFSADGPPCVPRFAMTERYLVLVEIPFVIRWLRLRFSGQSAVRCCEWQPQRGTRFHLIDKDRGRVVRSARGQPCFAFHAINAFEDGDGVILDLVTHPDPSVIDRFDLERLRSTGPVSVTGRLARVRIGNGELVTAESMPAVPLEWPRFHDARHRGRPYRYLYGAGEEVPGNFIDSLVKLDLAQGTSRTWHEAGCYPGEPVFVPRPEALPEEEDHGVVLSVVLDARKEVSFLLVLDATSFSELARVEAPHPIPFGMHGQFFRS